MATKSLLYRFPSSQSSSSTPDLRHSWPIYHQAHRSHLSLENVHFEQSMSACKPSASSMESFSSSAPGPLRVTNENIHPSRRTSYSSFDGRHSHGNASNLMYCRSSSGQHFDSAQSFSPKPSPKIKVWKDSEVSAGCGERFAPSPNPIKERRLSYDIARKDNLSLSRRQAEPSRKQEVGELSAGNTEAARHPFRRWMKSVRHKSPSSKGSLRVREERWQLDDSDASREQRVSSAMDRGHKKSSSWSSSGIVTAVKSATASLSVPYPYTSKRATSSRKKTRSSRLSENANQDSLDNSPNVLRLVDEAACDRARQRRRTIEEIVSSEESYVADLKVLVNVSCRAQPRIVQRMLIALP